MSGYRTSAVMALASAIAGLLALESAPATASPTLEASPELAPELASDQTVAQGEEEADVETKNDADAQTEGADALRINVTGENDSDYFEPNAGAATRTDTPIIETPASVQVIPREILDDQQVIQLDEALRNVSGVVVDSTEGSGFQYSIRGFQGARVLRDGFSVSGSDAVSNNGFLTLPEVASLERIEVLKGPASILYGEIQPGGVINLVTKRPTAEPLYEAQIQAGSRSLIRPQIDFSDRLTADGRLRYRINALYSSQDSVRDFDQDIDRVFVAPMVTWDIGDRTTLTLDVEYFNDERPNDSGLLAFGDGILDVPEDRIIGEPGDKVERDFFSGGYRLEHNFSDNWKIRYAFRYGRQDYEATTFTPTAFNEAAGAPSLFLSPPMEPRHG